MTLDDGMNLNTGENHFNLDHVKILSDFEGQQQGAEGDSMGQSYHFSIVYAAANQLKREGICSIMLQCSHLSCNALL